MNLHAIVGGGKILETPKEKFRTVNAEKTLSYLQPLQRDDIKSIISLYFLRFPSRPVTAEEMVSATGFPAEQVQAEIKSRMRAGKLLYLDGRGYFDRAATKFLKRQASGHYQKDPFKGRLQVGSERRRNAVSAGPQS